MSQIALIRQSGFQADSQILRAFSMLFAKLPDLVVAQSQLEAFSYPNPKSISGVVCEFSTPSPSSAFWKIE